MLYVFPIIIFLVTGIALMVLCYPGTVRTTLIVADEFVYNFKQELQRMRLEAVASVGERNIVTGRLMLWGASASVLDDPETLAYLELDMKSDRDYLDLLHKTAYVDMEGEFRSHWRRFLFYREVLHRARLTYHHPSHFCKI